MTTLAASDPAVFEPTTVHAFALTLRRLNDVELLLDSYPELARRAKDQSISHAERQAAEDKRVEAMQGIRIRAAWAFNWAAKLVERLLTEGGLAPSGPDEPPTNMFDIPKLDPDPFGRSRLAVRRSLSAVR